MGWRIRRNASNKYAPGLSGARGFWDLNPARKVRFFFPAFVHGLTNYVIRHHILIRKYDIFAMPLFPKMHHKPIFWAPSQVLHKLDDNEIQINVSDRLFRARF